MSASEDMSAECEVILVLCEELRDWSSWIRLSTLSLFLEYVRARCTPC